MKWDLLIKGAQLVIGQEVLTKDLAVVGERIAQIEENLPADHAKVVIDGHGYHLSAGFIDVHTHDDIVAIHHPEMRSKISQGVTTVITGNCGISAAPAVIEGMPPDPMALLGFAEVFQYPRFADYAQAVDQAMPAVNVAALVGHTTLRSQAMHGEYDRAATPQEVEVMCDLLRQAMRQGAIGLSSGLAYSNAKATPPAEIEALLQVVAQEKGFYSTHMRNERDQLFESIDEALGSARKAGVPLVISHLKCADPENWGKSEKALAMIEHASHHQSCGVDCYPYSACSTTLDLWRVREDFDILITWSKSHPEMGGKLLKDIAVQWNLSLKAAAEKLMPAGAIYHNMSSDDVNRIVSSPLTMIGSDGLPSDPNPHPRLWGTFSRVIAHYCRDEALMTLPEAIRKMTSLPAMRFGLKDRGELKVGYFADLTLFDFEKIESLASFTVPTAETRGIACVVVNGAITYQHGKMGARAGRLLKHTYQ